MDRVTAIWDDELTSILDIEKIGHRKRILLSLAGRDGIQHRFGKVKASTFLCHIYDYSEARNFTDLGSIIGIFEVGHSTLWKLAISASLILSEIEFCLFHKVKN